VTGTYSPDLIANINPPTGALLLVGVVHTSALSLTRDRLERISRRPAPAAFTAFVTPRTMSIYLWHMPVLLVMAGVTAVFSMHSGAELPPLGSLDWWAARPLWLALALALTALVAAATARFESLPAPACSLSSARIAVAVFLGLVGVLILLVLGTSVATAAIALALVLPALRLAQARSTAATPLPAAV
jgi:hypothetical protein